MKKLLVLLLIFTIAISPLTSKAEESVRDNKTTMIKEYMKKALDEYQIPGASLAVFENGEVILQEKWGTQSDGRPVEADTLFSLGSVSKPLTSLGIMTLVEKGELNIDHPIDMYLPSFTYDKNQFQQDITIRHLLSHTSGISSYEGFEIADLQLRGEDAIEQASELLTSVQLNHEPGEVHQYSAANYLLLGRIIEETTGQLFAEFVHNEVFSKLNMDHTAANYKDAADLGYQPGFQSWFGKPVVSENHFDDSGAPYGYMASNTNDMINFIRFMLNGGELISDQTYKLYTSPQVLRKEEMYYGLGWRVSTEKDDSYFYHGGETPDSRSELFIQPEKGYGFILLTNKNNFSEVLHTSTMRDGIKSIIESESKPDIPKASYQMQWMTLICIVVIAIMSLANIVHLLRRKIAQFKWWGIVGSVSIILSIVLIPLLIYIFGTPWHTIYSYAPDTAIMVRWTIGILAVNGIISIFIISVNKKRELKG